MKVVKADPSKKLTKWQPLLDAEKKRNSVLTAMRRRGIKVRTKLDHLHVYVRSLMPRKVSCYRITLKSYENARHQGHAFFIYLIFHAGIGAWVSPPMREANNRPSLEELLTVHEVAAILKVSEDTVTRRFEKMPGVVNLGSEETRAKQRYRVLRIPRPVLDRYIVSVTNR